MRGVPFVCPNGHYFEYPMLGGGNGLVTATNNAVQCQCGQIATQVQSGTFDVAPDGTYSLRRLVGELASSPRTDLLELRDWLQQMARTSQALADAADRLNAPQSVEKIRPYLRDLSIPILILLLNLVINLIGLDHQGVTPAQITQIVQQVESRADLPPAVVPPLASRRPGQSPARNRPCPCGSGRKYKRCHGRPDGITPAGGDTAPPPPEPPSGE